MKHSVIRIITLLAMLTLSPLSVFAQVSAVPPLMNFQGRLAKPDGTPVPDGSYSIRFSLHDALSGGTEKWNQTVNPVVVRNGTFVVLLSGFAAGTFNTNLWLEIKIGTDAPLTPRQQLVSVAYAMKADSVKDNAITSASIVNGTITGGDIANGTITANKLASNALNTLSWLLNGNSGVTSGFLGTTDNQPLNIRVNNRRVMRYQYAEDTSDPDPAFQFRSMNMLGGTDINSITAGIIGATIAGGGLDFFEGEDFPNRVTANFGMVGGGFGNTASGDHATVGGGESNTASGSGATIGGGNFNTSGFVATVGGGAANNASGGLSTVGGGSGNNASGTDATIGGGFTNTANNFQATVGGGGQNIAGGSYATVGGGRGNTASGNDATVGGGVGNAASGDRATVGGGLGNVASGTDATVGGGNDNRATGTYSFAAGRRAKANHAGTLVWADNTDADFASTAVNQFLVRAGGGVGINTNNPAGFALNVAGNIQCVSLTQTSDARFKTNVASLENSLDAILGLRGVTFDWNQQAFPDRNFSHDRQIGFLAQEVEKVLPELVSTDKQGYKSVAYQNVVPVLVEAMKQQQKQMDTKEKRLQAVEVENAQLKVWLQEMLQRLERLEANSDRK